MSCGEYHRTPGRREDLPEGAPDEADAKRSAKANKVIDEAAPFADVTNYKVTKDSSRAVRIAPDGTMYGDEEDPDRPRPTDGSGQPDAVTVPCYREAKIRAALADPKRVNDLSPDELAEYKKRKQ